MHLLCHQNGAVYDTAIQELLAPGGVFDKFIRMSPKSTYKRGQDSAIDITGTITEGEAPTGLDVDQICNFRSLLSFPGA